MDRKTKQYYSKRLKRLAARNIIRIDGNNDIARYYERRSKRMNLDADDENSNGKASGGGGNTRIPYGIAKREGVDTQGMTPSEVWAALAGKGYSASSVYTELRKTGKVPSKPAGESKTKAEPPKSEFAKKSREERKAELAELAKKLPSKSSLRTVVDEYESAKGNIDKYTRELAELEAAKSKYGHISPDEFEQRFYTKLNEKNELAKKVQNIYWHGIREYLKGQKKTKERYEKMYDAWAKSEGYENYADAAKKYLEMDEQLKDMRQEVDEMSRYRSYGTEKAYLEEKKKLWTRIAEGHKNSEEYKNLTANQQKYDQMLKEHHKATLEELGSVDKCVGTQEICDYLNATEMLDGECDWSIGGYEARVAQKSVKHLESIVSKYPTLKGKLKAAKIVSSREIGAGTYADSSVAGVRINSDICKDITKHYDRDLAKGFHPEGTDASAVLVHEYVHQIENLFDTRHNIYPSEGRGGNPINFSDFVVSTVAKRLKMKIEDTKRSVSVYATKKTARGNSREFFAEALAEYFCSEHPRPVAAEVGKVFEEYVGKIK